MNLQYYLRGLGLGILITALILGLSGTGKKSMTDAEIKKRAMELGMIENTVLTEANDESDETTEESEPAAAAEEPADDEPEETEQPEPAETEKPEAEKSDAAEPEVVDEEIWADETQTVQSEEETEGTGTENTENDTETEESTQTVQDGTQITGVTDKTIVLTIVQGDSSYTVARKLYDMGLVTSAEEYDRYLCQNGYDRGIRTGTYEIEAGTSLEQIAKRINGK